MAIAKLDLHAKVYFDVPDSLGQEIYVYIDYYTENPYMGGLADVRCVSFGRCTGEWNHRDTPLGGYVDVRVVLSRPQFSGISPNTKVILTGTLGYWIWMPTGTKTIDWKAELEDCDRHIIDLTN
jgi:hypothetical protein